MIARPSRRMTAVLALVFAVLATLFAVASAATPVAPQEQRAHATPAQTVRAFYMALTEESYGECQGLATAEMAAKIKQAGGFPAWLQNLTRGAEIRGIQTINEQIKGTTATVSFRLHFTNGTTKDATDVLVKEGAWWKIALKAAATK